MKTLIFAALCFLLVLGGCYDAAPFRNRRRLSRRPPKSLSLPEPVSLHPPAAETHFQERHLIRRQR
jgi:hypothetical protein